MLKAPNSHLDSLAWEPRILHQPPGYNVPAAYYDSNIIARKKRIASRAGGLADARKKTKCIITDIHTEEIFHFDTITAASNYIHSSRAEIRKSIQCGYVLKKQYRAVGGEIKEGVK